MDEKDYLYYNMNLHIEVQTELKTNSGKAIVKATVDRENVSPSKYEDILLGIKNSIRELEKQCRKLSDS